MADYIDDKQRLLLYITALNNLRDEFKRHAICSNDNSYTFKRLRGNLINDAQRCTATKTTAEGEQDGTRL